MPKLYALKGLHTQKKQNAWLSIIRKKSVLRRTLSTHPQFNDILNIIRRHPKLKDDDIVDVIVDMKPFDGKHYGDKDRCFFAVTRDHRRISVSQKYCVAPWLYLRYLKNKKQHLHSACRGAVDGFVFEFKKKTFRNTDNITCPLDGTKVGFLGAHTDHKVEFKTLVEQWLASIGKTHADIPTKRPQKRPHDGDWYCFVHDADKKSWVYFHNTHAVLRVTSAHGNLVTAKHKT